VRRACIDIGSNTTRLLVADCDGGRLLELHQERAFTRIGQALRHDGRLAPDKLDEVARIVSGQLASARRLGAVEVRCVATASVRRAANSAELVARIGEHCDGLTVEVLSGEDEARLAFAGAARMLDEVPAGRLGVVDVGGGSSELAVGISPDRVEWWASLPLGSGDLTDACVRSDPPSESDLRNAREHVAAVLAEVRPPAPAPALAVAVGGSATSLRRLVGPVLDADAIGAALQTLGGDRAADLASRLALDPERVVLLTAGLVILEAFTGLLGAPLQIGRGGLREGLLLQSG
jgi:exopolyphosphatase/guanosine-5'-triphosphate,3'-diphosphate pyrophosphatase